MDLSIIIINFNTHALTIGCIESIETHTQGISYEIIVVDNASAKADRLELEKSLKKHNISLIKNSTNVGFAKANNQGIHKSRGDYVLLLNSDTKLNDNLLPSMIDWLKSHPKAGVVSTALKNVDGSGQRNGGFFPNLATVFMWMYFIEDLPILNNFLRTFHPLPSKKTKQLDWVTGAFMLMPRSAIEKAGRMPEEYFMYTEDVDFCYQFKAHGYQVWYLPKFSITHFGGASGKSGLGLVSEFKTLKVFFKKHYPQWQLPILEFLLKSGAFLRMFLFGILKGPEVGKLYEKIYRQI